MAARRHCARALTRAASAPGYNAQYQAEIAIKIVAPAVVIIVANRFRNRSHTTIVTHNRMVGQRAGVCGRTKNANKNVDAKASRTATIKSSRAFAFRKNAATASSNAPLTYRRRRSSETASAIPKAAAATRIPIPKATSRTFQLARNADIESIRLPFRFDAAPLPSGFKKERLWRVSSSQKKMADLCDLF